MHLVGPIRLNQVEPNDTFANLLALFGEISLVYGHNLWLGLDRQPIRVKQVVNRKLIVSCGHFCPTQATKPALQLVPSKATQQKEAPLTYKTANDPLLVAFNRGKQSILTTRNTFASRIVIGLFLQLLIKALNRV